VTLPVEFSAEAEKELEAAARWFDEHRPGLGAEFLRAVDAALALVAEWPGSGAIVDEVPGTLKIRRAPIRRFRFHLAYLEHEDRVRVLAVAHDHRKPGYWASRTED
jgi:plasmid stabilization system protein ParE